MPSPLHLYVHIPYCVHKCHYCDFNSHVQSAPDWAGYQQALITELRAWLATPMFAGRRIDSIFFGGGTPSLAPSALIAAVIQTADQHASLDPACEISLEANPGTVDAAHFRGYRAAGVNRLSIGAQSFHNQELAWLERIHSREAIIHAVQTARAAGFEQLNLDLMYGLPMTEHRNPPMAAWLDSLQQAIDLAPEHLSCYQLTVEPHTKLAVTHARAPLPLPDDELAIDMLFATRERLAQADYHPYEISNYARPDCHCRHNDSYWLYHDYIGIGAGAAGKWDHASEDGGITRYSNLRQPATYIRAMLASNPQQANAIHNEEQLSCDEAAREACWLGLRRQTGINRADFQSRFGFDPWDTFRADLQPWQQRGMLAVAIENISLTTTGLPLADAIAASVLA